MRGKWAVNNGVFKHGKSCSFFSSTAGAMKNPNSDLSTIVVLNRFNNPFLRLGSIVIGLTLGFIVAWWLGRVDLAALPQVPLDQVAKG